MAFTNAQLFKQAEDTARRAHRKQLVSEKDFAAVWETIESWIKAQVDVTKGAHILNFVKIGWVVEPASTGQLRPMFVLLDSYAKTHSLQCGPGATLVSSINRGWQMEPVEDINFSKLALRFSQGLGKDTISMCVRVLVQALGSVLSTGQAVDLRLGVGIMRARGRKVSFEFDSQYSRGRTKQVLSRAHVPMATRTALPGERAEQARIVSSRSHKSGRPASCSGSLSSQSHVSQSGTDEAAAVAGNNICQAGRQELQAKGQQHQQPANPSQARDSATSTAAAAWVPLNTPFSVSRNSSKGREHAPLRNTSARWSGKLQVPQEDMACLLMHGVGITSSGIGTVPAPNTRPYGTDIDTFDSKSQQRGQKPSGRRHFRPDKAQVNLQRNGQEVTNEPTKGKRMNRFIQGEDDVHARALQRHLDSVQQQKLQDENMTRAMDLRKKKLDKEAVRMVQHRNMKSALLAEELRVQMATRKLAQAEQQSVASSVPLIQREDPSPEVLASQAKHYRQELDGQVMEKAFTKHQERVMETYQDLAMIADAQEDLLADVCDERERVRAAQAQMRADWEQQIAASRQAEMERRRIAGQAPGLRPPPANSGREALKPTALVSLW